MSQTADTQISAPRCPTAERRRFRRVPCEFRVRLLRGRLWAARRGDLGVVHDHDDECFRVRTRVPVQEGERVRLAFPLPETISYQFKDLGCRWTGVVLAVRPVAADPSEADVVVKLDRPVPELAKGEIRAHQRRVVLVLAMLLASMLWLKYDDMRFFWYAPDLYLYSFLVGGYFLSRFFITWFYEAPPYVEGYTPPVTIVISARNEEEAIEATIDSCFAAEYPEGKREVIVVNDGSTDRTQEAIERSKKKHPELIAREIPPSGKREGMATGVRLAKGELIVFVDSDTFLFKRALREIVSGFQDPTLGAVSGQTLVANANLNFLTAMQDVRYYASFRLMKAAESVFGTVSCCPGCLSCYRKEYLLKILDPWLHQRFLGAKATFGDDRSLTNYILRDYRVLYNERAIGSTLVPETWMRFMKQQLRWKKSWLRETYIGCTFIWKKHPLGALSFILAAVCSIASPFAATRVVLFGWLMPDSAVAYYIVGLILLGVAQSLFAYLVRPSSKWLYGVLLVPIQLIVMSPQTYYAMLTMRKNHWGTR